MSQIEVDGTAIPFAPGNTVAAALWAGGSRSWRVTRVGGRPRGLFCGIGTCFDCLVTVDGVPNRRACVLPARDGMRVRTQTGTGWPPVDPSGDMAGPDTVDEAVDTDVVVVGAGPAGLAAAVSAWRHGARVVLLDAEAHAGGQYWRHPAGGTPDAHHEPQEYRRLAQEMEHAIAVGGIDHRRGHRVWRLEPADPGRDEGRRFAIHAQLPDGGGVTWSATAVVLATGTAERVLPFPGWELPGVITAGGAQALLSEHGLTAGRRVVVGGTGPFLLPVAAALAQAGATVVGVHEANSLRGLVRGWASGGLAVAGAADKFGEAAAYATQLARQRVPVRPGTAVVAAHGVDRVEAVSVARLDQDWRIRPGTMRRVECDAVAVGWGFVPRLELAVQAGCELVPGADGGPVVQVDDAGQSTTIPGLFAAGEITAVAGARSARWEGEVAGRAAARWVQGGRHEHGGQGGARRRPGSGAPSGAPGGAPTGAARRARAGAFARAMHAAHPIRPGWVTWLQPDTLICRCEEVPLRRLDEAVALGAEDLRTAKLLSRCGMGWCQGRVCGEPVARILAERAPGAGRHPPDWLCGQLAGAAARPLAVPVTLGELAAGPGV